MSVREIAARATFASWLFTAFAKSKRHLAWGLKLPKLRGEAYYAAYYGRHMGGPHGVHMREWHVRERHAGQHIMGIAHNSTFRGSI